MKQNLKIKVNNEHECKEVQELFFALGYGWHGKGKKVSYSEKILGYGFGWLVLWKPDYLVNKVIQIGTGFESVKEITINQLRDMVVLKRNDPKDANYESENGRIKYYLTSSEFFEFMNGVWVNIDELASGVNFKPIKKEEKMKEYLNPLKDGGYELSNDCLCEDSIEVPDGADILIKWDNPQLIAFYKKGFTHVFEDNYWEETPRVDLDHIMDTGGSILWQREQPSQVDVPPMMHNRCITIPIDPVELTLADRQSQYGSFENVATTTQKLYDLISRGDMTSVQREAMHMICSKLARIANGDPNHVDSWHDIAGYATLVVKDLEK